MLKRIYIAKAELDAKEPMILVHYDGDKHPAVRAFELSWDGPARVVYWPQGPVPAKVFVEVSGPIKVVRPDLGTLE